ncbi:phosphotyrosine protein phosphatase I superfamily [Stachybotrys elegans]|uniref:Phosphotyrosine protein phosphatase I superfamily n=1 Tax=Stachybotrys elegans TaxID=80388 RepID=A0A8K0SYR1_9HYPO|nr:phosphotyrosine protein phosphatase I superfamily [Stachybotrys elegans]
MTIHTTNTRTEANAPPHVSALSRLVYRQLVIRIFGRAKADPSPSPILHAILHQDGDFSPGDHPCLSYRSTLTKQRICLPSCPTSSVCRGQSRHKSCKSPVAMPEPISVLFVCLGNICRSPMAEGIFRHIAKEPQFQGKINIIDSCGTAAYHSGEPPDSRTMSTLEDNGITDYRHLARRFQTSDLDKFDYIFAMDRSNLSDLQRAQRGNPDSKAKVMLFGSYSGSSKAEIVDDPYYGGRDGFEKAYEQCTRFSRNFLKEVLGE